MLYMIDDANLEPKATYYVGSGKMLAFDFNLDPDQYVVVTTVHTQLVQDSSLRLWFSQQLAGPSVELVHPIISNWHPPRKALFRVCLYTGQQPTLPVDGIVNHFLAVEPGSYYLNVLNLANSLNAFYMEFDLNTFPQQ